MGTIQRLHNADLPSLIDRINKYSIGMDDYFDRLQTLHEKRQAIILHLI